MSSLLSTTGQMRPESMEETLLSGVTHGDSGGELEPEGGTSEDLQLTRIGHYVLLQRVGRGAMGVVYAAYDETLDRKVAIKLLHSAGEGHPRLLREAQALARLSHPNVVQVYEVGTFEEAPFIAMEFVDGLTLRAWIAETRPTQAELLAVFDAAGQGLVAAHDKGLVHRDFKPDNVMVARDGRVVVMDFGLARGEASAVGEELVALSSIDRSADLLPAELTMTGTVMGTPAYMAPEQYRGRDTGAASDQFSFCVALWEALCAERPFRAPNLFALEAAIVAGHVGPAPQLPSWLRRVLLRGLNPAPRERWPSMEALLAALADDPTRRRTTLSLSLLGALALLVIVIAVAWMSDRREREREQATRAEIDARCSEAGGALARSWTQDSQARLASSFGAHPGGEELWLRTAARLDAYATAWGSARERSCLAAAGRVEQPLSPALAERGATCLGERRVTFETLLEVWAEVDREETRRAPGAAAELPLISSCSAPNFLAQQVPAPTDAGARAGVLAQRTRLERAAALQLAADYDGALVEVERVLAEAEALGWAPLLAEARFANGDLLERLGDFTGSTAQLREAFFIATDAGHDFVALQAATKLTWTVGVRVFDHEAGLLWAELAGTFVRRLELQDSLHEAKRLNALAALKFRRGEFDAALVDYRRALELRELQLGAAHPQVGATLNNIGLVLSAQGNYGPALVALQRSLAIRSGSHGPRHPDVAGSHNNLSIVFHRQGKDEEAREHARMGLKILLEALGPEHTELGSAYTNLGVVEFACGDFEAARKSHEQGLRIKVAKLGEDHTLVSITRTHLGEALLELGEFAAAKEELDRALAGGGAHKRFPEQRARNKFVLAKTLVALDEQPARAQALVEEAAELLREAGEAHADRLKDVETWLAQREG